MKDEILKRIDALADKLGIASSELWKVLLQQARVEAYIDIGYVGLGLALIVSGVLLIRRGVKMGEDWEEYPKFSLPGVLLAAFGIPLFFVYLHSTWTPLFNPSYWALQQILETIKGA